MVKINPRWLEGLKYSDAEVKIVEKNGRKTQQGIPRTVSAKEEHVLSCRDLGDKVVIVIKDGKKYTVEKNPGSRDSSKAKE